MHRSLFINHIAQMHQFNYRVTKFERLIRMIIWDAILSDTYAEKCLKRQPTSTEYTEPNHCVHRRSLLGSGFELLTNNDDIDANCIHFRLLINNEMIQLREKEKCVRCMFHKPSLMFLIISLSLYLFSI